MFACLRKVGLSITAQKQVLLAGDFVWLQASQKRQGLVDVARIRLELDYMLPQANHPGEVPSDQ